MARRVPNCAAAVKLCIAQAKKYVSYCGGSTQVVVIAADGQVIEVAPTIISQNELMTALIVEDVAKVVFYATDPLTTGFDGDKMKEAVDQASGARKTGAARKKVLRRARNGSAARYNCVHELNRTASSIFVSTVTPSGELPMLSQSLISSPRVQRGDRRALATDNRRDAPASASPSTVFAMSNY
jgi:hypothetical protein